MILPSIALLGIGAMEGLIIVVGVAVMTFWIWMVVDCATHETNSGAKLGWLFALTVTSVLAAPLYFLFRRLPRKSRAAQAAGVRRSAFGTLP